MSTDILLVSRACNPADDSRYQHANAPAVRVEIIEGSWMFDLVVNGVEVASRMTTTDLRVLWRRLGVYLDGVGELTDEDRSARVNLAAIESTQPDTRELGYENLDDLRAAIADAAAVMSAIYDSFRDGEKIDPVVVDIGIGCWLEKHAPGSLPEKDGD